MKYYRIRKIGPEWHVFIYEPNADETFVLLPDECLGPFEAHMDAHRAAVGTGYNDRDRL